METSEQTSDSKSQNAVQAIYHRDSAELGSQLCVDECHGVDGGISIKFDALEANLFDRSVKIRK